MLLVRERSGEERAEATAAPPAEAASGPAGLASALLDLQRTAGNRAVVATLSRQHAAPAPGASPAPPPPPGAPPVARPKTPKEKFQAFVGSAAAKGLPTTLFGPVAERYTIAEGDIEENETDTLWNEIKFKTGVLDKIAGTDFATPATISFAGDAGSIFHETMHAYLDVKSGDPKVKRFIDHAMAHYTDAALQGGGKVSDPYRVMTEAAAEYVGERVPQWWMTLSTLTTYVRAGKLSKKLLDQQRTEWEKATANRVFGYQERLWSPKTWTERPISDEMKRFLDEDILEGKMPDRFDDVPAFKAVLAGVTLAE